MSCYEVGRFWEFTTDPSTICCSHELLVENSSSHTWCWDRIVCDRIGDWCWRSSAWCSSGTIGIHPFYFIVIYDFLAEGFWVFAGIVLDQSSCSIFFESVINSPVLWSSRSSIESFVFHKECARHVATITVSVHAWDSYVVFIMLCYTWSCLYIEIVSFSDLEITSTTPCSTLRESLKSCGIHSVLYIPSDIGTGIRVDIIWRLEPSFCCREVTWIRRESSTNHCMPSACGGFAVNCYHSYGFHICYCIYTELKYKSWWVSCSIESGRFPCACNLSHEFFLYLHPCRTRRRDRVVGDRIGDRDGERIVSSCRRNRRCNWWRSHWRWRHRRYRHWCRSDHGTDIISYHSKHVYGI